MLSEHQSKQPAVSAPAELGLTRQEAQQFSIVRAVNAYQTNNWTKAGFERDCSRAVAERLGRDARGFYVPLEVQRTMSVGDASTGGYLVGDTHRADLFIEALRARSIGMQAGVRMLDGLVGNVNVPKHTGNATFYWLSEGEDVTTSDVTVGQISMRPRTVAGAVPMTRRLMMQSSPSVEQLVREDLMTGAALAIDRAIFEGDGVKEPLGIFNHADINTVAVATDGSPTWLEALDFEGEVETDNALAGSLNWVTTPTVKANMKGTSKDTGSGQFVCSENNIANGYPVLVSTQLASNRLGFGDWSQIIVGMWGVLDVKPDEAALAASGGLVLRVFQDADVGIRHAQAFAVGT
jgi:HK97 family phage major capsid protein